MMRLITEYDLKMSKEIGQMGRVSQRRRIHLREDAPEEVKKYYEKLRKEYSMFD